MVIMEDMGDHFRFDFFFTYKNNQTKIFKIQKIEPKLSRNRFQLTSFNSVWFDYFILKTKT